jgi:SAM-dependent methyltransferase
MSQSVERFSNRVQNYRKYRPGYPASIVDLLQRCCGLTSQSVIADIGSGTGKLAEIFLENGNRVFGVEPNAKMRAAAGEILSGYSNFISVDATAEATELPAGSIDFVAAAQAFHWFDSRKFKIECLRILKPGGYAVLIWNQRLIDTTPFLRAYEELLSKYGTDYQSVRHENAVDSIARFFAPESATVASFATLQEFDLEGLRGRVLSSSYTPDAENPNFEPMLISLQEIFDTYQQKGKVSIDYDTKIHYGRLS